MIDVNLINTAMTAGAGTNIYAFSAEEKLKYGAEGSQPAIATTFSLGTPYINGSTVLFPCTILMQLTYTNQDGTVVKQQQLTENFTIGTLSTSLPATAIVNGLGTTIKFVNTSCCKSYGAIVSGSFSLITT